MASPNRMMKLIAFLQAQNCSNLPGSWRHPATMLDFLTPEYYQRIARTLEDGKIQMAFFDDRLALPDLYTGHHAPAVGAGVRAVKLDPATVLMTMGMATTRLGLGRHLLDDLLRAVSCRARLRDDGSDAEGPGRLERRDLAEQRGGRQFRVSRAYGARRPLRPRRRIHGGRARPLEHLGRRRADPRQGDQPLRRPRRKCIGSTTRENISARAGRSACRARRRAIR